MASQPEVVFYGGARDAWMQKQSPLNILLVEDDPVLVVDLEAALSDMGHTVVGIASNAGRALEMSRWSPIDAALVDLNLSDGPTGLAVARVLISDHDALVIFITGDPRSIPSDFVGALGVVSKPCASGCFDEILAFASALKRTLSPPPASLILAPWAQARVEAGREGPLPVRVNV